MNRLIHTELLKQRATRMFVGGIVAAPILSALVTVAILAAAGSQGNEPLGPAHLVHVIGGPSGALTLVAIVLGVFGMAGEYRHQTITTTFLASPRRRDVLIAKLAAYSLTGAVMGLLSIAVSVAIAVPWLLAGGVDVTVDDRAVRVAVGLVLSTSLYGALGVSIGALIRNQTAATTAVLVWMLAVEGLITDLVRRDDLMRWLPAAAGRALVVLDPTGDSLSLPIAAAVFTAYVAAFAVAGIRFTLDRDIT
jgi:ABC-2 type transport system permease protein